MQNINKTLVLDIRQNEISIVPKFALQQLLFSKLLKVDTTLTFHTLPEMKIVLFRYFKYGWVYRIYYKQGIWTIYVLEFNKMETAQRVIDLLKS